MIPDEGTGKRLPWPTERTSKRLSPSLQSGSHHVRSAIIVRGRLRVSRPEPAETAS